jgi:hypothetical protein
MTGTQFPNERRDNVTKKGRHSHNLVPLSKGTTNNSLVNASDLAGAGEVAKAVGNVAGAIGGAVEGIAGAIESVFTEKEKTKQVEFKGNVDLAVANIGARQAVQVTCISEGFHTARAALDLGGKIVEFLKHRNDLKIKYVEIEASLTSARLELDRSLNSLEASKLTHEKEMAEIDLINQVNKKILEIISNVGDQLKTIPPKDPDFDKASDFILSLTEKLQSIKKTES